MEKLLTIAGSDCSGGAGIQADMKTFIAHNTYAMSVITAITVQNTLGVVGVQEIDKEIVKGQIDAVFQDIRPDAVKVGMVSNSEIIKTIVERLKFYKAENIVVDPVMVSTSGSSLMNKDAKKALIEELLPIASVITPNIPEAEVLSGIKINDKEDMIKAAEIIAENLNTYILIKGGHLKTSADDLLYKNGEYIFIQGDRINNENTHGTGCTLSSAIASNLAKGYNMEESIRNSKDYITGAIKENFDLGRGRGPLNHLYNLKFND